MAEIVKHEESVLCSDRLAFQASLSFDGLLLLLEPGTLGQPPGSVGASKFLSHSSPFS